MSFLRLVLLEGLRVFDTLAFGIAFVRGIHGQLDIVGLGYTCLHCILCWWSCVAFEIPSQFCLGELGIITSDILSCCC
jgi:hypothetical protein